MNTMHPLSKKRQFDPETGTFYHIGRDGKKKAVLKAEYRSNTSSVPILVDPLTKVEVDAMPYCQTLEEFKRFVNPHGRHVEEKISLRLTYLDYKWNAPFSSYDTSKDYQRIVPESEWTEKERVEVEERKRHVEKIRKETEERVAAKKIRDEEVAKTITWNNKCEALYHDYNINRLGHHLIDKYEDCNYETVEIFLNNYMEEKRNKYLNDREERAKLYRKPIETCS